MINKYLNKTLTVFLTLIFIFGLFPPIVFSQPNSFSSPSIGEIKGFNRSVFDNHFSRADREINPQRWLAEARLGITQAINSWELFAGNLYENPLLLNEAKNQLENWSNEEIEKRFSQWLTRRFFGNAVESAMIVLSKMLDDIQTYYTWRLDENGNILFDDKTGDPMIIRPGEEGREFSQDLINWRKDADESIIYSSISFNNLLIQLYPELLSYIPNELRETMEAVICETSTSMNTAIKTEFENLAAREENKFTSLRTRDIWSLRKKSDSESARLFTENLIAETEESCKNGINELKIKIEQAEAGTGNLALLGEEWLQLYKEQFDKGLKAWEEAEERFFIRRIEWEQDSFVLFSEGLAIWQDAFDQFEKQRQNWELSVKELFDSGEKLFDKISDDFKKSIEDAKTEFNLNMNMRVEEGKIRVEALIDMYLLCASTSISALENVEFLHKHLNISNALNPKDAGYYSWLVKEFDNGNSSVKEIKKSYDMYTEYRRKALETKDKIIENYAELFGTGALKDILSPDVSSEDFHLDEYQIALIRAKALVLYWERKTDIAEAVMAYASELTAGRITEAEGLSALEDARTAYNISLDEYKTELKNLNLIGNEIKNQQTKLENLTIIMRQEEEKLNKLQSDYINLVNASVIQNKDYYYKYLNQTYDSLVKEYKTFQNTEDDAIYKNILESGLSWSVLEQKENSEIILNILINGYEDLSSLQEIQDSEIEKRIRMAAIDLFGSVDGLRSSDSKYSGADWYSKAKDITLSEKERSALLGENLYKQLLEDYNNSKYLFTLCMEENGENLIELYEDLTYCIGLLDVFNEYALYSSFIQNEFWQASIASLSKLLKDYNINSSTTFLPDAETIIKSIKNKSGDFFQNTAKFLFDLNNCFSTAPEWITLEINNWKHAIIEYSALYAFISDLNTQKNTIKLDLEMEETINIFFTLYDNINQEDITDNTEIESLNISEIYKTLNLLDYQFQITEEFEKYSSSSLENEKHWRQYILDDYIINNDPSLISASSWKNGALQDAFFKAAYYTNRVNDSLKMFSSKDNTLTDDTAEACYYSYLNADYNILLDLNKLEDKFKEIAKIGAAYEFSKLSTDEIDTQLLAQKNTLENQEEKYKEKIADFFEKADEFITIGSNYDTQYGILKTAYDNTEQRRFEYEKQDAIQRWASTSYLNTDNINLDNCKTSLLRAQTVLNVLSDLYSVEDKNTYKNPQYEALFSSYEQIFNGKLIVFEAAELLTSTTIKEYSNNESFYINYYNSLNQLGYIDQNYKNYTSSITNKNWTVKDIITVKDGRLAFSTDSLNILQGIDKNKADTLNDYFTRSITSDGERFEISAYEEALRGLSERMSVYFQDDAKFKQWSMAREYLLYTLINANKDITDLKKYYSGIGEMSVSKTLGKSLVMDGMRHTVKLNDLVKDFDVIKNREKYYREAWINLTETEKADLEFYVIITLQNNDYTNGFNKYHTLEIYKTAKQEVNYLYNAAKELRNMWFLFVYFSALDEAKDVNKNVLTKINSVIKQTNKDINKWETGLTAFLSNIKSSAVAYKESCDILNALEGIGVNSKNIEWNDIKLALENKMEEEKINELKYYWEAMQENYGNTYKSVAQALVDMRQLVVNEEDAVKKDMEALWAKAATVQKENEKDFLSIVDSYFNGTKNINDLKKAADKAYGENAASQKYHLSNMYNVMLNDLSLYLEVDIDFYSVFSELGKEIISLTETSLKNRYMAELAAREADWNQALKDIAGKKSEWQKSADLIIEAGRTDWKTSKEKMEAAKNQWVSNFINEYNRVENEWNIAYLAGLEDKERWLQQAAEAANTASSEALLSLIGAEGERLSRFVDTREPLGISYEIPEAQALMAELLQSSGIINLSNAFASINNIASTASSSVKRGIGGISIWNAANVKMAAYGLARETNEKIANMETIKLAYNVRSSADEAINGLVAQVNYANKNFRSNMDDHFIYSGLWSKKGNNYEKEVIKGSTLFTSIITEKATIKGYADYKMEPIILKTNLDEEYLAALDTIAIRGSLENAILEIKEITDEIFGKEGEEAKIIEEDKIKAIKNKIRETVNIKKKDDVRTLSPGKFGAHIGYSPDLKKSDEMGDTKNSMFNDKGSGELGRMLTDYIYWAVIEEKGNAELCMPAWEKRMWNDEESFFKAPSLRKLTTIASAIIVSVATFGAGSAAGIAASIGVNIACDLAFEALDLAAGYKDVKEFGLNIGKSILTNTISGIASGAFNGFGGDAFKGLTTTVVGASSNTFYKIASQSLMTGVQTFTTSIATTAISGITLDKNGKLAYNKSVFNSNYWDGLLKNSISSMAGTFVTSGLTAINSGLDMSKLKGFNNINTDNMKKLNGLLGSLAEQGVNFAMGNDFTLNVLNMSLLTNGAANGGILELHLGRSGTTMNFGMSGANVSFDNIIASLRGAQVWNLNTKINNYVNDKENNFDADITLRAQYGYGDDAAKDQLYDILNKKTIFNSNAEGDYDAESTRNENGQKVINLTTNTQGLSSNEQYLLAVILGHEAHRDGYATNDNYLETRTATAAHTEMALKMFYDGKLTLNDNLIKDIIAYNQGSDFFNRYIDASYDSSGDYWMLMRDGTLVNDNSGWLVDELGKSILNANGEKIGANEIEQGLLNVLFGGTSGISYNVYNDEQVALAQLLMLSAGMNYYNEKNGDVRTQLWTSNITGQSLDMDILMETVGSTIASPVFARYYENNALSNIAFLTGNNVGKINTNYITDDAMLRYFNNFLPAVFDYYNTMREFLDPSDKFRIVQKHGGTNLSYPNYENNAHFGTDFLNGRSGDPIYMGISGNVIHTSAEVETGVGNGNWMAVEYGYQFEGSFIGSGIFGEYMHMQVLPNFNNNTFLNSNQIIGTVGNTGRSTAAHLHYSIYTLENNPHSQVSLQILLNNNTSNTIKSREAAYYIGTYKTPTKKVTYDIENYLRSF